MAQCLDISGSHFAVYSITLFNHWYKNYHIDYLRTVKFLLTDTQNSTIITLYHGFNDVLCS